MVKKKKSLEEFYKERYDKALVYSRYTLTRYATAMLCVINLYWLYMVYLGTPKLLFIPIIKLVIYIICFADQFLSMEKNNYDKMKWTDRVLKISVIIDLVLIILSIINYKKYFPYFSNVYVPLGLFGLNTALAIIILYKNYKIKQKFNIK